MGTTTLCREVTLRESATFYVRPLSYPRLPQLSRGTWTRRLVPRTLWEPHRRAELSMHVQQRSLLGFGRFDSERVLLWMWIWCRSKQATTVPSLRWLNVFECGVYVWRAGVAYARPYRSIRPPVCPPGHRRPVTHSTGVLSRWWPSYFTLLGYLALYNGCISSRSIRVCQRCANHDASLFSASLPAMGPSRPILFVVAFIL